MKSFILALSLLFFLSSCTIDYTYEVTGSAKSAIVSYTTESGSISQEKSSIPWEKCYSGYAGDIVTISAQNGGSSGDLSVKIYKEGRLFKSSSASGPYGVASTSGEL